MTTSTADPAAPPIDSGDLEALEHLHRSVEQGAHWFTALLEAIALWHSPAESYQGRHYRYLIGGEAFDWLLLAERLCEELKDVVPLTEKEALLFFGRFPIEMSPWEFQRLIGRAKYRGHLNFWYGVLVEEAIILAIEERLSKEHASVGFGSDALDPNASYQRIYGTTQGELLMQFQSESGLPPLPELSLAQLREFIYWGFKYRLNHQDPAKVASDTRLGLQQLQRMQARHLQSRSA